MRPSWRRFNGATEGEKALITGGSKGIGEAIVRRFSQEGAHVVFTYNSSKEQADQIQQDLKAENEKIAALKMNGSQPEHAKTVIQDALAFLGGLDILVNNAGTGQSGSIKDPDFGLELFDHIFDINVRTLYALTHAAVPHMTNGGRIINVSSILGERAIFSDTAIYNASKFAVTGLTRSWAHDLGADNITVNAIQPGPINTDLNPENSDYADEFRAITPLSRYGRPEEVANLAAFLASDESSYITGATINIDGGVNA